MIRNIERKRTKFHENMAQKHSSTKYNGKLYLCLCKCVEEKYANFRPKNQAKTLLVNSVLWVCSLLNYVWKLHDERSSISIWINIDFSIIKLRLITVVGPAPILCGLTFSFSFWVWIEFSFLFLFPLRSYVLFFVVVLIWYLCSVLFLLELVLILLLTLLNLVLSHSHFHFGIHCAIDNLFYHRNLISIESESESTSIQFESNKCKEKQKQIIRRRYECSERFTVPPKS